MIIEVINEEKIDFWELDCQEIIRESFGGCHARFIPIDDKTGIKLYRSKSEAIANWEAAKKAAEYNVGPATYGLHDLPEFEPRRYLADGEIDRPFRFGFLQELCSVLELPNYYDYDDDYQQKTVDDFRSRILGIDNGLAEELLQSNCVACFGRRLKDSHIQNLGILPNGNLCFVDVGDFCGPFTF